MSLEQQNDVDRVWLKVPFEQKDMAKSFGARWDPAVRLWWVHKIFLTVEPRLKRWLPAGEGDSRRATRSPRPPRQKRSRSVGNNCTARAGTLIPATDFSLPNCNCTNPPWEHCEHSLAHQAQLADADAVSHMRSIAQEDT